MSTQRGNILFLILLAIILFAALTYAVNSGMRGGVSEGIPKEKARALAAQIIQNASVIEQHLSRAMLVDGVKDYGFDMLSSNISTNSNATCVSGSCKVFIDQGGPIASMRMPAWAMSPESSAHYKGKLRMAEILNLGTSAPELVIVYRDLRQDVCQAFNDVLNIKVDLSVNDAWENPIGLYSDTITSMPTTASILGNNNPELKGRHAFCFYHLTEGYTFIYALMTR